MKSFQFSRRVRYRECDPMGVVYHVHYLNFFEEARTEALREWGMAYKNLESTGIILPVVDLALTYRFPAEYDEVLHIETRVEQTPLVKLRCDYDSWVIRDDKKIEVVSGHVTLAFVNKESKRPTRAPKDIAKLFEA